MLYYVSGDLFAAPVQTLVNTVNTVGVMGKGLALTFKQIYPEMYTQYRELCDSGKFRIGSLFIYRAEHKVVLNFPTKEHWRNPSRLEYIRAGLETFVKMYDRAGIHQIAFPPLGCGNGELDFADVRPLMEAYLAPLPIPVYIYAPLAPRSVPEHRDSAAVAAWLREAPAELPFSEVWEDILRMLRERSLVDTLGGTGSFEASAVDDFTLRLWMSGGRITKVDREEFADLWKRLRDFGILTSRHVRANRVKEAAYVLGIFAALPYVQRVPLSEGFDLLDIKPTVGLQLKPMVARPEPQRELALL